MLIKYVVFPNKYRIYGTHAFLISSAFYTYKSPVSRAVIKFLRKHQYLTQPTVPDTCTLVAAVFEFRLVVSWKCLNSFVWGGGAATAYMVPPKYVVTPN